MRFHLTLEDGKRSVTSPPIVSGIDEDIWYPPAYPEKKKCQFCPTLLRMGNRSRGTCDACETRMMKSDKPIDVNKPLMLTKRQREINTAKMLERLSA